MPVARIVYSWNFELFCLALAHDQPNNLASVDDWICMLATLETTVCGPPEFSRLNPRWLDGRRPVVCYGEAGVEAGVEAGAEAEDCLDTQLASGGRADTSLHTAASLL